MFHAFGDDDFSPEDDNDDSVDLLPLSHSGKLTLSYRESYGMRCSKHADNSQAKRSSILLLTM